MAVTKGKIVITFTRDVLDGETLSFERINNDTLDTVAVSCTFVDRYRAINEEVSIGINTGIDGESEAIEYEAVFNIDHNFAGLMTISRVTNVVTIEIDSGWDFQNFSTDTGATEVITGETGLDFNLISASLQVHPTDPCNYVDVDVLMDAQADSYILGSTAPVPVATNPFTVSIPRLIMRSLKVRKAGSADVDVGVEQWGIYKFYFRKVVVDNVVNINVVPNQFSGATVTVVVWYNGQNTHQPENITLTYSLNDIDYQSSNVFTGQVNGSYTMYIKDNFGCTVSKDFEVTDSGTREEYFSISNVNSINFSKDEVWDGLQNGIHKNEDNVLSLTEYGKKQTYDERLIFRDDDLVRIQFKSNYENHDVEIYDCEGDLTSAAISVTKMSQNLNLFQKLDCKIDTISGYGSGVAGLYFDSGQVYNEASVPIGNYTLNGNLPDFAQVGVFIKLSGGSPAQSGVYEIKDLIYDSTLDKRLIIFDYNYVDTPGMTIQVEAYYDLIPFEIYEFDVDMSNVLVHSPDKDFRVKIQASDNSFDTINYYSEYITLVPDDDYAINNYVAIQYYNENNRDIFYLYGITHFIRAEVLNVSTLIDDDNEIVKGDFTTYISESTVHNGIEISFREVTHKVMLQIVLALSSENLFINGIGYIKSTGLDVSQVENTNLYLIKAQLLRTGKNFNVLISDRTGQREGYTTTFLPKIITTGTEFIKT